MIEMGNYDSNENEGELDKRGKCVCFFCLFVCMYLETVIAREK